MMKTATQRRLGPNALASLNRARYAAAPVAVSPAPALPELAQLRAENAALKAQLARSRPKLPPQPVVNTDSRLAHYEALAARPLSLSPEARLGGFRSQAKAWFCGFAGLGVGIAAMHTGIAQIVKMMGW